MNCVEMDTSQKEIMALSLALASPLTQEARRLIQESDHFAQALYPAESNHLVDARELASADALFCIARLQGEAVGCGAAILKPEGYAEIKRMFVHERARGQRVGYRILLFLEEQLRQRGIQIARLETGIYNHDAIRLYEKMGYVRIPPFGDYWDDPLSVFYEKQL
jgi:putative acetyltransferase